MNRRSYKTAVLLLLSFLLVSSFPTFLSVAQQVESMAFTSGEKIDFTSDTEMTFKSSESPMTFGNETMIFGTGIRMQFIWAFGGSDPDSLERCDWIEVIWPIGFIPEECTWWEVYDPTTGLGTGFEFHIDGFEPPYFVHIDDIYPPQAQLPIAPGEIIYAEKKIMIIDSCEYFEVHWPSHWWPEPCSWWEIVDPDTGELSGYEFHVDWTNSSCEFHVDKVIGPSGGPEPWGPWSIGAYEVVAVRKIPGVKPCDYFIVHDPPDWGPEVCTWWEIMDPDTGEPTGYEFHVDWSTESCEFHVDKVTGPDGVDEPYIAPWPGVPYITAEPKIDEIIPCDLFVIVDGDVSDVTSCSWWEILDENGAPTGWEFHIDWVEPSGQGWIFHVDDVIPDPLPAMPVPWPYTVSARKKIDDIEPCDWFWVDDPSNTPEPCTWWEVLDSTGNPTGWEFHVGDSTIGYFHVDDVIPGPFPIPPTHMLTAEKKIDDIKECDWFKVLDPPDFVPEPCSWWVIIWPPVWAGIHFHVDANDDIDMFHIDDVNGGGPPPPPPPPPPWNVTAIPYEPPPLPWYMKPSYPDYAPSGMPDFDQRQGGTYIWQDLAQRWSHCGPTAVANSLWWLDSQFETSITPPPAIVETYPLVQSYNPGGWDDHDPQNVPPLVEHLAFLMDTDGRRTGIIHSGTDVFDMQAGITHYLSWSGVNPLGDVDGDGIVTISDLNIVNAAFGTFPGMALWDLCADIWPVTTVYPPVTDNIININDVNLVKANMGQTGLFYEHTEIAPIWDIIVEEVLRCQDVVLLIAPWYWDPAGGWYRHDESAHFVTVAGLNATTWEIVLSDPILDNAEAGGYGDVPVPHIHPPPEPPYITHNNASLVSHDAYHVIEDPCPGGPLTIPDYPRGPGPYPEWRWQIEAAVITSPYAVHDVAVTNCCVCCGATHLHRNVTARINVTVANQGSYTETFDVTVYWNMTNEIETKAVTLVSGANTTIQFHWNTTNCQEYDNYTISAYAHPVLGETDLADNTYTYGTVLMVHEGDVDGDKKVRVNDVLAVAMAFGSNCGEPEYDPNCDITCDSKIRVDDVLAAAVQFGWGPP